MYLFFIIMPCHNKLNLNIPWPGGSHKKVRKEWCVEKVQITLCWDLELALYWAVQIGGHYMNISEKVNCIKNLTATGVLLCSSGLPNLRADF